ncbi:secreted protein C-like [Haliotis rubra]|uniref:secreted protein C-like n=1 Tax=Haliotis rubra TaxID=36100 RepID=UPI001EE505E4|nr:secreted protein C-like [Haliotis rubra]
MNQHTPHSQQSTLLSMPDFPPQQKGQGTQASDVSMSDFSGMDSHMDDIHHSEGLQATSSSAFQGSSSASFQGSSAGTFQGSSAGTFQGSSAGTFQGSSSDAFQGSSSASFHGSSSRGFHGPNQSPFQGSCSGGFQRTGSATFQTSTSAGSVSGASQSSDASHARHHETQQGNQDEAGKEQSSQVQSSSSINITFISNPCQGESQVQVLTMDEDGILVYRKPEQDWSQSHSRSPEDGVSPTAAQQKVTNVQPPVPQDNTAYNLQMLGDVALLGQNLSRAQSSSVFGDNGKVMQNL